MKWLARTEHFIPTFPKPGLLGGARPEAGPLTEGVSSISHPSCATEAEEDADAGVADELAAKEPWGVAVWEYETGGAAVAWPGLSTLRPSPWAVGVARVGGLDWPPRLTELPRLPRLAIVIDTRNGDFTVRVTETGKANGTERSGLFKRDGGERMALWNAKAYDDEQNGKQID